jgi:uncharacterized protein (TIGR02611 family)
MSGLPLIDPLAPHKKDNLVERSDADSQHHHPLIDAAVEAEFETGVHEETIEEAKRHILFRLARMTLGFAVLLLGIIAIPAPGPGWLIVALGLGILSRDFIWAERMLNTVRKRLPQTHDGKIPQSTWIGIAAATVVATGVSIWWGFYR